MDATTEIADTGAQGANGYRRLVFVLMLIYTYAFVDRVILALLVDPVRASLGVSDIDMSLLLGLSFAAVYCACNIPAGYLADRVNRRLLIGVAAALWASMTVLCGLATSFSQLLWARAGVGIAEGVISPTAFSLIRDGVPTRFRALAFSVYAMGPMLGGALSLAGGGALLKAASNGAFQAVPFLGALEPWQCTLVIVGVLGLPLSLLVLLFREPPRLGAAAIAQSPAMGPAIDPTPPAWRYMLTRWSAYLPLLIFSASGAMMSFGVSTWLPAGLGRAWHMTPQQIGPPLGLMTLLGGIAGLLVGGSIMNRAIARGGSALSYGVIGVIGTAVGLGLAFAAPRLDLAFAGVQLGLFFIGVSYAAAATTLAQITPVAMMGRVSALYLVVQTLIGQSAGPFAVAAVSRLLQGPSAVLMALSITMIVLAGICVAAATTLIARQRAHAAASA